LTKGIFALPFLCNNFSAHEASKEAQRRTKDRDVTEPKIGNLYSLRLRFRRVFSDDGDIAQPKNVNRISFPTFLPFFLQNLITAIFLPEACSLAAPFRDVFPSR
jgi:hypothetical protein